MRSDPPCWELVGAEFIEDLWGLYTPKVCFCICQWELQDPKMEVLYHIRPYFVGIFPYIGLKNRPYIW
jgi:hypothetical protein